MKSPISTMLFINGMLIAEYDYKFILQDRSIEFKHNKFSKYDYISLLIFVAGSLIDRVEFNVSDKEHGSRQISFIRP